MGTAAGVCAAHQAGANTTGGLAGPVNAVCVHALLQAADGYHHQSHWHSNTRGHTPAPTLTQPPFCSVTWQSLSVARTTRRKHHSLAVGCSAVCSAVGNTSSQRPSMGRPHMPHLTPQPHGQFTPAQTRWSSQAQKRRHTHRPPTASRGAIPLPLCQGLEAPQKPLVRVLIAPPRTLQASCSSRMTALCVA